MGQMRLDQIKDARDKDYCIRATRHESIRNERADFRARVVREEPILHFDDMADREFRKGEAYGKSL